MLPEPRSILLIQLRRIGDVILATPAARALKARYPNARLDFLVEPPGSEALQGRPELAAVHVYRPSGVRAAVSWIVKLRSLRYDWVVDLMGNPRTAALTAFSGAAVRAGPAHVFHRWAYNVRLPQSSSTQYAAREKILMLAPLGVPGDAPFVPTWPGTPLVGRENVVGLVPASRKVTRAWPPESYAELGKMLRDRFGCEILVFWGPGERRIAEQVAEGIGEKAGIVKEATSLQRLAEELSRCKLVVTNCAGPKHVAVALGVPTVTIHGSSDPAAWTPPDPRHVAVRRDELHCIGCRSNECRYALECLRGLSARRVFDSAAALLQGAAAR